MSDLIPKEELKELDANKKAEYFIKLTELKKRINEEYNNIRAELLETTQKLGIKQLKTDNYTISRAKRTTIDIYDHELAGSELEKLGYTIKYQKKISDLSMPTVKEVAKGEQIDGIEVNETEYVLVRLNKEN
jgi:hypothetical protein